MIISAIVPLIVMSLFLVIMPAWVVAVELIISRGADGDLALD